MKFGFKRHELQSRYDVVSITEDEWHSYTGEKTTAIVRAFLPEPQTSSLWLLNAGSGVYDVGVPGWREIPTDLFLGPLHRRRNAVCTTIEQLPFRAETISALVCVGEVLGYCDPAAAFTEFARVLRPSGVLICDFASSRSPRYWLKKTYGRAADLITDEYNGEPERTWAYDPRYIKALLSRTGFRIEKSLGTHSWSAVARRCGGSAESAVRLQRLLEGIKAPALLADLVTVVASRFASGRRLA